jgi:hypothetical protein
MVWRKSASIILLDSENFVCAVAQNEVSPVGCSMAQFMV